MRRVLDSAGWAYEVIDCDPELADTASFCEHYGYPPERSANTIIVASKKEPRRYAACVVLATTRLEVNTVVRRNLGVKKCSFASAEETAALTGMVMGGVTPFALPIGIPILVDERVMPKDWVVLGGGSRSCKIKVSPEVLRELPDATVVPGLAL